MFQWEFCLNNPTTKQYQNQLSFLYLLFIKQKSQSELILNVTRLRLVSPSWSKMDFLKQLNHVIIWWPLFLLTLVTIPAQPNNEQGFNNKDKNTL